MSNKIFLIIILSFLLFGCLNLQKQNNKKLGGSTIKSTKYKTTSGKIFIVHIDHSKGASICEVQIETRGFTARNSTYKLGEIDPVKKIFLADLDNNGFEEIYLITQSAGSGSYGNIYGVASNKDKSATPVYIRPISEKQIEGGEIFEGFMGHNQFKIESGKLVNYFPVYRDGDSNANPTGGKQKIQYHLIAGEAGWILEPINAVEL